jgi:aryl-alcohol dehydrogenase-like predicted oxidoreductase
MNNRSRSPKPVLPSVEQPTLRASETGTAGFRRRFEPQVVGDYFRATSFGLHASSIGIGTYLGEATDKDDEAYEAAIYGAIRRGVNLVDTAINYRGQRSERAIGSAIQQLIASSEARREELIICSKGGYIPLDREAPATREEYQAYVKREFIDQEVVRPDEIVAGGHSLAPRFLRYCLAKSRQNLGLRTIDVYYVHNPGQQLSVVSRAELRERLRAAFMMLEEAAGRAEIGVYGCATWESLRVPPESKAHLGLEDLVEIARELAGDAHHFRAVQLPINLAMPEAARDATQPLAGKLVTTLDAATALGLTVVASATLMQAKLTSGLPTMLHAPFPRCTSDAQRAIEFVRSMPGITTALVGMKRLEHVDENLGGVRADPV